MSNNCGMRDYGSISGGRTLSSNILPVVNLGGSSATDLVSLSDNVLAGIQSVVSSRYNLQKMIKIIGTLKDTERAREKIHQIQVKTNNKLKVTCQELQALTNIARDNNKLQKLYIRKLTIDFQVCVKHYSEIQNEIATKMKRIVRSIVKMQEQKINEEDEAATDDDNLQLIEKQAKLEHDMNLEELTLREKQRQFEQIESDLTECYGVMRELNRLVVAQEIIFSEIETNTDCGAADVENGTMQSQETNAYQMKYCKKVIILLIIIAIVGIIVTFIVISLLSKNKK